MIVLRGTTRLRSLDRHLRAVPGGSAVVVALTDLDAHKEELRSAGLSDLQTGERVLPAPVGKVSQFNAEGRQIVRKDLPKEKVTREQLWTWEQWHGPYTVTQTRIVDVPYERYPREFVEPPSLELFVAETTDGDRVVVADAVTYEPANAKRLLHVVNLFRELFGEAAILDKDLKPLGRAPVRRLNWEVLPEGEIPWAKLSQRLQPILDRFGERKGPVVEHRLRLLTEEHEPDFTAVGRAGFQGYIIFGFKEKGLYILESLEYGNATYVLGENWETISQRTKAEILRAGLQRERIIHQSGWQGRVRKLLAP